MYKVLDYNEYDEQVEVDISTLGVEVLQPVNNTSAITVFEVVS